MSDGVEDGGQEKEVHICGKVQGGRNVLVAGGPADQTCAKPASGDKSSSNYHLIDRGTQNISTPPIDASSL